MITYDQIPTSARHLLAANYTPSGCVIWWNNRNRLLDNHCPRDVWNADPDRVLALLEAISEGVIF